MKDRINFCTLFDSNYLSRGVTMYHSLEAVTEDFHLYVFAFDDTCLDVLHQLNFKYCTIISLQEFEDEDLLRVKAGRTTAEYCWTCSSSTILYCIEKYQLTNCTYIDADMYFYQDPSTLIAEMKEDSVMITAHRYTPKYDKTKLSGKYCVQFVYFKNDEYGMRVLRWWRNACIEWCFNRYEDGKFGDQKYLDDWTTRFPHVHELQHLGGGLALWNIQQYALFPFNNLFRCREIISGKIFDPVFYHFHYLKYFKDHTVELGRWEINDDVLNMIYKPYLVKMNEAYLEIKRVKPGFESHGSVPAPHGVKAILLKYWRKMNHVYHIYKLEELLK